MDREQQQSERIEAFVMGRMTAEEASAFKLEVEENPDLKEMVELHYLMKEALGDASADTFRERVREVIEEEKIGQKEAAVKALQKPVWWLVAAVLIALAGFLAWFVIGDRQTPSTLYAAYYDPYPVYQINRSDQQLPGLQEAMEYYGLGEYAEAAEILQSLRESGAADPDMIDFYFGITLMEKGDMDRAEGVFRSLDNRDAPLFDQQARWYLALTLLRTGRVEDARNYLDVLKEEPGKFGKEAASLMRELEKISG